MSKDTDNGGTAFPIIHPDGSGVQYWGLSVRDYFAAAALQGLLSGFYSDSTKANCLEVPEEAYRIADGMLEVRKQ